MGAPYLPGFGRCGIPRTSSLDCAQSEEQWASGSVDSREADDRRMRAPIIRYQQRSHRWQGSVFLESCKKFRLAFVNQKYQQDSAHDERQTPHQDFEELDERRSCHVVTASLHRVRYRSSGRLMFPSRPLEYLCRHGALRTWYGADGLSVPLQEIDPGDHLPRRPAAASGTFATGN